MELFKTVPACSWLFIYFRKYKTTFDKFFPSIAYLGFNWYKKLNKK